MNDSTNNEYKKQIVEYEIWFIYGNLKY